MSIFISYIFLGLSLSAPIGPINAAQLDKGIKNGFLHAWLVGIGAMAADALYMIAIYLGVAAFLDTPFLKTLLYSFGFFILTYTGIESILTSNRVTRLEGETNETKKKAFVSGFLMALSNPLNILFWLGIYGAVLAKTAESYTENQLFIYSLGIFVGILIWDVIMASIASGFRKMLKPQLLQGISIIAGLSLVGFGLYFGYEAFRLLF
ncbi:LysE family transporter [Bacillus kexueae]|uniref:LysE family transporter n=1 Tax=Aeribacillus kexueae TaxID=2078952 RepID=UPI001FAF08A9|nr:LysE family transporter [Bacillus kexueae]